MNSLSTYLTTLYQTLRGRTLLFAVTITILYIILSVYAVNSAIFISTLIGKFPIEDKAAIISALITGSWGLFQPLEAILLLMIGILMGITLSLMLKSVQNLRGKGRVKFSFGGSSMVAVMSVGCPGCGISLLSLAGVSTPLLPISGVPLQILSVTLLSGSLIYLLKKTQEPAACVIS